MITRSLEFRITVRCREFGIDYACTDDDTPVLLINLKEKDCCLSNN